MDLNHHICDLMKIWGEKKSKTKIGKFILKISKISIWKLLELLDPEVFGRTITA